MSRPSVQSDASSELYRDMMTRFLGPTIMQAFDDPAVTEVYTNPQDHCIWIINRSGRRLDTGECIDGSKVVAFLNTVATALSTTLGPENPALQAELPLDRFRRSRLQGLIPPVASSPCFVIRKHAAEVIPLETYVQDGGLTAEHAEIIRVGIASHWNVLIVGGTRTGKTTLAGAILHEITRQFPQERILILEDTAELRCTARDHLALRTPEGGSLADLVKLTLRLSPDRIVVGEVRDHAALYMLDAWQTGHPGSIATLHATSPQGALLRLDLLCQRANVPSQIPLIAEAVQLVVHIELRTRGGRIRPTVTQLALVAGLDTRGRFLLQPLGGRQDDAAQEHSGNGSSGRRPPHARPSDSPLPLHAGD